MPDYRDLWTNGTYYPHPYWRRLIERRIERRWLSNARAITAVTPGFTQEMSQMAPTLPCHTIWNGYSGREIDAIKPTDLGSGRHIVYAGIWYQGKRDPRPVLDALVTSRALQDYRLHLVGPTSPEVAGEVARRGLGDRVVMHGPKTRAEALSIVMGADIALIIGWNDPRDKDVIGGKVFELMGMRKPILALAYENGVLADATQRYGLAHVANESETIAHAVRNLQDRVARGEVPDAGFVRSLERSAQLEAWEELLTSLAG